MDHQQRVPARRCHRRGRARRARVRMRVRVGARARRGRLQGGESVCCNRDRGGTPQSPKRPHHAPARPVRGCASHSHSRRACRPETSRDSACACRYNGTSVRHHRRAPAASHGDSPGCRHAHRTRRCLPHRARARVGRSADRSNIPQRGLESRHENANGRLNGRRRRHHRSVVSGKRRRGAAERKQRGERGVRDEVGVGVGGRPMLLQKRAVGCGGTLRVGAGAAARFLASAAERWGAINSATRAALASSGGGGPLATQADRVA